MDNHNNCVQRNMTIPCLIAISTHIFDPDQSRHLGPGRWIIYGNLTSLGWPS
jgi:hypothetical protein